MANQVKLEIYVDVSDQYRWRLIAGNGEPVAASEAYERYASAKRSAERVKELAHVAVIVNHPNVG